MRGADRAGAHLARKAGELAARITRTVLIYHPRILATDIAVSNEPVRCAWAARTPLETIYHDTEWGVPQHDDRRLFEFLILEGAQAGLSWSTILAKREGYRAAFDDFDPQKVARYSEARLEKLLLDPGIVRNRLKVWSARSNAQAFLQVQQAFGSFAAYYWAFSDDQPIVNHWRSMKDVPAKTALSDRLSKDLLKRGFKFVGSTIVYAYMQATGMVNDHLVSCHCHPTLRSAPR
ncbi:MAG: DNA-3-methyladenine glycosylase I [Nevskiaceae bacterium]|nr:MAG: DNA-3-methyladenine glycosylase I [Nevskiaceae bacterium]